MQVDGWSTVLYVILMTRNFGGWDHPSSCSFRVETGEHQRTRKCEHNKSLYNKRLAHFVLNVVLCQAGPIDKEFLFVRPWQGALFDNIKCRTFFPSIIKKIRMLLTRDRQSTTTPQKFPWSLRACGARQMRVRTLTGKGVVHPLCKKATMQWNRSTMMGCDLTKS